VQHEETGDGHRADSGGGAPISALLARMLLSVFVPRHNHRQNRCPTSSCQTASRRVAAGRSGIREQGIARKLEISLNTVGSHVKNLYRKLPCIRGLQVVRAAQERGLV